jgi:acylphosphatase
MSDQKTEPRQVRIVVRGRVQGVAYRAATRDEAIRKGLVGTVRNLPNGNVEIVALGSREGVEHLIEWCRRGPPLARVSEITVADEPLDAERPTTFSIRY